MAKILFAWEFGDYLGHVGNLVPLMRAIQKRGHKVYFVAKNLASAYTMLAPGEVDVFQAPRLIGVTQPKSTRCYADILHNNGYSDAATLQPLVSAWWALYKALQPDVLVFDYAPTAQIAGLDLNIPKFVCGNSYYHPAPGCSAVDMCYWSNTPFEAANTIEGQVMDTIREVVKSPVADSAQYIGDLLDVTRQFIPQYSGYDLYRTQRNAPAYLAPISTAGALAKPVWRTNNGRTRVFAYLKADKPQVETVVAALSALALDVVCFISGGAHQFTRYAGERLQISDTPLDSNATVSQSDLVICHAGMGVITSALYHGRPLLLLPTQPEQVHNTLCTESLGVGVGLRRDQSQRSVREIITRLITEPNWREAAKACSKEYRSNTPEDSVAYMAGLIESEVTFQ